jgi:hypothetical protein
VVVVAAAAAVLLVLLLEVLGFSEVDLLIWIY